MKSTEGSVDYILVTPAHNEQGFIEKTIESVIRQTVLPVRWIIVDDSSTDGTGAIVRSYAKDNPLMELLRVASKT